MSQFHLMQEKKQKQKQQNSQKRTGQPGKHRQRTVIRAEKENVAFLIKHCLGENILSHNEILVAFVSCEELQHWY